MVRIEHIGLATDVVWQDHWRADPNATFSQSPTWAAAWADATDGRMRPAARLVTFRDGCTAVLAVTQERHLWQTTNRSSPAGTYGGWVSGSALSEGHRRALTEQLLRIPDLTWRISPFSSPADVPPSAEGDTTQVLDLSVGMEAGLARMRPEQRRSARRAERQGVEVALTAGDEDWAAYLDLYRSSRERWGDAARPEHPEAVFRALARRAPDGVELWLATRGGSALSGAVLLSSPTHTCYWHGAATDDGLKLGASPLLFLRAIEHAHRRGARWFDFNPSGGLEGVRTFKSRMGATDLPAPIVRTRSFRSRALSRFR